MKLKHLLVLAFLVVSALPLFFSLQYLNQYTSSQYRQHIEEHLLSVSLIAKKRVIAIMERIEDSTSLISSRTQLRVQVNAWNTNQQPKALTAINQIIGDAKESLGKVQSIAVYNTNGQLITATQTLAVSDQLTAKDYLSRRARLFPLEEGVFIQSVDALVLDSQIIGYIVIHFVEDFLVDLINDRTGLGTSGEWLFAVRDDKGDALFAVPLKYDRQAAFQRTVTKDRLDVPITQALLGNEILMSNAPDYMETPVLAATRYLPKFDWGLVAKISEDEVASIVNRSNRVLIILEVVIIFLAILFGFGFSFYIANPVEKLRKHTSKLATGDFGTVDIPKGWREVKDLGAAFNDMALSLKDLNDNLNAKVIERTKALDDANQKLQQLAIRDPLTNLFNRRYFEERLYSEFERAKRYQSNLTLVMLDIDHFKQVNDTYGHPGGDIVIIRVADYLQSTVRDSDLVARIGGEEFCLLLPSTTSEGTLTVVERMRVDIGALVCTHKQSNIQVTCSFGVASINDAVSDYKTLLSQADLALYQAKESGRNRVVKYTTDINISHAENRFGRQA